MNVPYSWLASAGVGLAVGLSYHAYVMRGIELDTAAEQVAEVREVIVYREREVKQNADNTAQYLEALDAARKETDRLRNDSQLAIRLCRADATVATVEAGNSSAAKAKAEADSAQLREDLLRVTEEARRQDAWVESAWEWVNRGG